MAGHTHESAGAALGAPKPGKMPKPKARKKFMAEELHDGSYGITKHHGDGKEPEMASAQDLDGVHDALEEHMGEANEGEEDGE